MLDKRLMAVAVLIATAVVGLTSCTGTHDAVDTEMKKVNAPSEQVDLSALRDDIRRVQQDFVDMIPEAEVVSYKAAGNGVLLSCAGGEFRWTGVMTVEHSSGFDAESFVADVEQQLATSADFTTVREVSREGLDYLVVTDTAGTDYTFRVWSGLSKLQIAASSWCFPVEPGQTQNGQF